MTQTLTAPERLTGVGQTPLQAATPADAAAILENIRNMLHEGSLPTAVPFLPLMLNLKGQPYTLDEHFVFEEWFRFRLADEILYKTGRQLGKSVSMAANGVVMAATIDFFSTLFVTPLYEQIRRFSSDRVGSFIKQSPLRNLWVNSTVTNSVLYRQLLNNSQMWFSFAFTDAERTRGLSCDRVAFDEVQNIHVEFLPIILETLSASKWKIKQYTGTPKSLENTIEQLWGRSSQAEWFIPCVHCTTGGFPTWNIPSIDHHLYKMLGTKNVETVSYQQPGVVCHKCSRPIFPHMGRWVHRDPAKRWSFPGFHVPQAITPLHYADHRAWALLLAKQQGFGNTTPAVFHNEVLGESYDVASRLVSVTELKAASKGGKNSLEKASNWRQAFADCVIGVDWGGGGEEGVSFTTVSVVGLRHDGLLEVLYGERLLTPNDHLREADRIRYIWERVKPRALAHDFSGAGGLRETVMVQAGVPYGRLMPMAFVAANRNAKVLMYVTPKNGIRPHYRYDKTRALLLVCTMIRLQRLLFFDYDHHSDQDCGLIYDFLALAEDKNATTIGDIYRIMASPGMTDDFAQATAMACSALWRINNAWPNFTDQRMLSEAQIAELSEPDTDLQ